ncbi:MAG: hypothetical protein LBU34_13930, partial [Planctomycetaceae bacterium]|nr:hypothetical protein [Planctomycetaceae bacterium]
MTHELILTSVSQGLEPDTSGYCIVAENRKIPRYLTKRLEALSEYQHLAPSASEQSQFSPVAYSHLIFSGHNTIWHTLSRIADAGTDYRFQPNQLAHHIVLTENELVQEGPAWLLLLPGFHFTDWLTPSVRFSNGRTIPTLTLPPNLTRNQRIARERRWTDPHKMTLFPSNIEDQETYRTYENETLINPYQLPDRQPCPLPCPQPCPLWRELTGDAGWAGILAETVQTGQQAVLVFRPGMNILPLIFEAISILPAELHWKGTFSTYYFKDLPEHTACQWKAVLAGSPIAERLLKNSDSLILDLTKPLGTVPSGKYVEFARTGLDEMLPKNEIPENPFSSDDWADKEISVPAENLPQQENQPENPPTVPETVSDTVSETPAEPPEPDKISAMNLSAMNFNDSVAVNLPPVITKEALRIQTKAPKPQNLFSSILNMKSRGQFYLLYGVTLLLLLVLLFLVLDQVTNFGLTRFFWGNNQTNPKPAAGSSDKPQKAKTKEEENVPKNKIDNATLEAEKRIKQEEEQKQQEQIRINAARASKKLLQDRANAIRSEIAEQKKQIRKKLNEYLSEHKLPDSLAMSVPQFQDDHVNPPESKTFPELTDLHPFGLAVELQYIPLLDIPNVRVETHKHTFFRDVDEKDIENNSDNKNSGNKDSGNKNEPLAAEEEKTSENTDSKLSSELSFDQPEDLSVNGLQVPVTDRFEWSVMAVDTDTLRETPMFDLKLTEQGLSVDWRIEGMDSQHLYDTLAASFGFLRISADSTVVKTAVENTATENTAAENTVAENTLTENDNENDNTDNTIVQSIPLFEPKIQKPLFLMEHFVDPKQAEFSVEMPFTAEPWRSFFATTNIPFAFRLAVTVKPDDPEILRKEEINSIDVKEPNLPSEFFVEFQTQVESKKTVAAGSDTYLSVTISFEGAVEPERVVWYDRSGTQIDILKTEMETNNTTLETMKKDLDIIKKEILVGTIPTTQEQRKKRNELQSEITK